MAAKKTYLIEDGIEARCAPEAVMAEVLAPRKWPSWQSEILRTTGPDRIEEGDQVSGEARLAGFRVQGRSDAHVVTEDVFMEDVIVGVRMVVTYQVEPTATGTRIKRTLECDLPGGPSGWVLSLVLRARLRKMQRRALAELAAQAEAEAPD